MFISLTSRWNCFPRPRPGACPAQAGCHPPARRNARRIELDLKQRLAFAYQQYANAYAEAEVYKTQILPKSLQTTLIYTHVRRDQVRAAGQAVENSLNLLPLERLRESR